MGMEVRAGGEGAGLAGRAWKCSGGLGGGLDVGTDAWLVPKVSPVPRLRVAALQAWGGGRTPLERKVLGDRDGDSLAERTWGPQRLGTGVAEPRAVPPGAALSLEVISLICRCLQED